MASNFYERVYEVVRLVPHGRVTTYGAIAEYLGTKSGARTVGYAMRALAGQGSDVPTHRVLNRKGQLTGMHAFGPGRMQQLLEAEGHMVTDNQLQDFSARFWHPRTHSPASF